MKINFKKSLLTLLPLILTGCATFNAAKTKTDYLTKHGIPNEFYNYRKKAKNVEEVSGFYHRIYITVKEYDLDGDREGDVGELYLYGEKEPFMYGFDYNKNKIYDDNEQLFDEAMDGLNENEIRLDIYLLLIEGKKEGKII